MTIRSEQQTQIHAGSGGARQGGKLVAVWVYRLDELEQARVRVATAYAAAQRAMAAACVGGCPWTF